MNMSIGKKLVGDCFEEGHWAFSAFSCSLCISLFMSLNHSSIGYTKWLLYSRTNKDKYTNIYQNQTHFDSKNKNKKISFLSRSQQLKNSAGHRNGSLPGYDLRRIVVLPNRIVTVKTI